MLDIEVRITIQNSEIQAAGDGNLRQMADIVTGKQYATPKDLKLLVDDAFQRAAASMPA